MHGLETIRQLNEAATANGTSKHLWAIMRPMQSNAGRAFTAEHHAAWDDNVIGTFGGVTFMAVADGVCTIHGKVLREPMQQVNVIGTEKQMFALVRETMMHYDQLAVMYYRLAGEPRIIKRSQVRKPVVEGAN